MKKLILFLLAGGMILSSAGCSKSKETAQQVMEKAQQNYADAYGLELEMDADYTIAVSGMEIKMAMEISMKQENWQDPEHLVMESDMEMQMLGQTLSMKEWVKDGVAYFDDSTAKTKQELEIAELSDLSGKVSMFSQDSLKEFGEHANIEKTDDGYVISGSLDYEKAFENIMGSLGLGESMGMDVSSVLSTLKVETFDLCYNISDEYEIEKGHVDLKASMMLEGQEMTLDLKLDMKIEPYQDPNIKLPDFSEWDMKSVSCSFEGEGISELMIINALDDHVTEVQSYMVIDYASYGVEGDDEKENFIQNMQDTYQNYEGVECSVDDLGDEIGVTIAVDMNKASLSTLIELGLASESSIEGTVFSLAQSVIGLEASGYDCE